MSIPKIPFSLSKSVWQMIGLGVIAVLAILLVIYAVRYVPAAISRLTGAVYLATENATTTPTETEGTPVGTLAPEVEAEVPPPTIVEEEETPELPDESGMTPPPPTAVPPTTTVVRPTYTYPQQPRLYGLSDLSVEITSVGYLRSSNASSFREADEVPEGERPAMKFTVRNRGTNVSGTWRLKVDLPTGDEEYTFNSQPSLLPNASKNYTIYFDEAESGNNQVLRVEVDYRDDVNESNERNNIDQATLDIKD